MAETLMKATLMKATMMKAAMMKPQLLIALLALSLSACSTLQSHEKAAATQAKQAGLVDIKKSNFDVSFALPDANLNQYKKVILNDLDMSNVKIIRSSTPSIHDTPWELNDGDKAFYQQKYREAAEEYLVSKGVLTVANTPASDTLVLKMKIIEISPLGSKDDFKGRPSKVDVYTQGFGRMTAVFELYDSASNKLLSMASDEQELGTFWEKNDRVQANMRINLAFEYWFKKLSEDMPLWPKN
jgi:hypothetical protein